MKTNRRNLLWYFLNSNVWKTFESQRTINMVFQSDADPERYYLLLYKANHIPKLGPLKKGVKIFDYVYDMYDCVYESRLTQKTKDRLSDEISDLLIYHEEMDTIEEVI